MKGSHPLVIPFAIRLLVVAYLALGLVSRGLADGPPTASATRVNWAKYQTAWADSAASDAQFATDGIVNAANAWRSNSGAGGHWVGVTLPEARLVGSVQVFLGNDDYGRAREFQPELRRRDRNETACRAAISRATPATVRNVVLASPVAVRSFMFLHNGCFRDRARDFRAAAAEWRGRLAHRYGM
jgi:hypothetical protein